MNREQAYFHAAKAVSELSDHKFKLGCVVVNKHTIISSGHNSLSRSHKIQNELDQKAFGTSIGGHVHAEVAALLPLITRKANLNDATLYVYREDRNGHIAMARPCPRCMSLIKKYGIKKIHYTTYDGFAIEKII